MRTLTYAALLLYFPGRPASFYRDNAIDPPRSPAPVVKRAAKVAPILPSEPKAEDTRKFVVCIESSRVHLLDEDNLVSKYLVDGLRYAGLIPGDEAHRARIFTTQKKVAKYKEEKTEVLLIEVKDLPNLALLDAAGIPLVLL